MPNLQRVAVVRRQERLTGGVNNNIYVRAQDFNPVVDYLNGLGSHVQDAIVATSVSTTTDFGGLLVGDLLVQIPAAAGTTVFETVVTAGTKPSAAVVGDLYIVLRS